MIKKNFLIMVIFNHISKNLPLVIYVKEKRHFKKSNRCSNKTKRQFALRRIQKGGQNENCF